MLTVKVEDVVLVLATGALPIAIPQPICLKVRRHGVVVVHQGKTTGSIRCSRALNLTRRKSMKNQVDAAVENVDVRKVTCHENS
jgi:hypothetical protein